MRQTDREPNSTIVKNLDQLPNCIVPEPERILHADSFTSHKGPSSDRNIPSLMDSSSVVSAVLLYYCPESVPIASIRQAIRERSLVVEKPVGVSMVATGIPPYVESEISLLTVAVTRDLSEKIRQLVTTATADIVTQASVDESETTEVSKPV